MSTENKLKDSVPAVEGAPEQAEPTAAVGDHVPTPDSESNPDTASRLSNRALIAQVASELGETEKQALLNIHRMIRAWGQPFVQDVLVKARETEAAGGLLIAETGTRRTFGGTFFWLARQTIGTEEWRKVIPYYRPPKPKKVVDPRKVRTEDISFEDACRAARAARAQPGECKSVKIILTGTIGRIVRREPNCVIVAMESTKIPDMPKGFPPLPPTPTRYTVFISRRHWFKLEDAYGKDPVGKTIVVDGFPTVVKEFGGDITVFALALLPKKEEMLPAIATNSSPTSVPPVSKPAQ